MVGATVKKPGKVVCIGRNYAFVLLSILYNPLDLLGIKFAFRIRSSADTTFAEIMPKNSTTSDRNSLSSF
jgi:hypothetical protein